MGTSSAHCSCFKAVVFALLCEPFRTVLAGSSMLCSVLSVECTPVLSMLRFPAKPISFISATPIKTLGIIWETWVVVHVVWIKFSPSEHKRCPEDTFCRAELEYDGTPKSYDLVLCFSGRSGSKHKVGCLLGDTRADEHISARAQDSV